MAVSSKISFLFFLVTFLTSHHIYARESQFFNKIPSNTNNLPVENQPKQEQEDPLNKPDQEPNFIPENENGGYGLYGHESGQLPPTTTTKTNTNLPYNNEPNNFLPKNYNSESYVTESEGYKPAFEKQSYPSTTTNPTNTNTNLPYNNEPNNYLPKNYNSESYVTESEGYKPAYDKQSYPSTTTNPTNTNNNLPYNNEPNNYLPKNYNSESYVTESEGYKPAYEKQNYPATTTATAANVNGQYYDENNYNENQQGVNDFKLGQSSYKSNAGNNYNYNDKSNGANINPVVKQGMSDTRFLENGKYFHDLSLEKNNKYPSQNTQGFGEQYSQNGGYYGNGYENFNSFSNDEFENQGEQFQDFQDEKGLP